LTVIALFFSRSAGGDAAEIGKSGHDPRLQLETKILETQEKVMRASIAGCATDRLGARVGGVAAIVFD
jgi:hypothetical protein